MTRAIQYKPAMLGRVATRNKWQTRRVVSPQPMHNPESYSNLEGWLWHHSNRLWGAEGAEYSWSIKAGPPPSILGYCPWKPGDWVPVLENIVKGPDGYARYAFDGRPVTINETDGSAQLVPWKFKPSRLSARYMPRHFARVFQHVAQFKDIRFERLSTISQEDAIKEGVYCGSGVQFPNWVAPGLEGRYASAHEAFRQLWDSINGARMDGSTSLNFDSMPWVWVLTFDDVRLPAYFGG
jgi:hypothetical protein